MKRLKFLLILLLATSCQFFNTEKISSDTFYEEEIKAIEWDQVDQYPAFKNCANYTEKAAQKECFESTLGSFVSDFIRSKDLVTHTDLNSTVQLDFIISKTGAIDSLQIAMDSLLQQKIPKLKDWLTHSIDSLPPLEPALKRGIPVKTKFTLPVLIQSEKSTN